MSDNEKDVIKEAIKEWMDERYAEIGKWTVRTILTIAVTGLLFAYIKYGGFKIP